MAQHDRIPEEMAPEVFKIAARLHAKHTRSYSPDDLVEAGAMADIPPEFVHQAIHQLQSQQAKAQKVAYNKRPNVREAGFTFAAMLLFIGAATLVANSYISNYRSELIRVQNESSEEMDDDGKFNQVNLEGANLSGRDLKGANLNGANLEGANLSGTDLTNAQLENVNLEGADLSGANLSNTNLTNANLEGANLSSTNLSNANLGGANLRGANLKSADLAGANFEGAFLNGANLDQANLDRTKFEDADREVRSEP